jgi:hypothetical protein
LTHRVSSPDRTPQQLSPAILDPQVLLGLPGHKLSTKGIHPLTGQSGMPSGLMQAPPEGDRTCGNIALVK